MYALIAQAVRYVRMENKRRPTVRARNISELRYLHLLLAITTAWQSSGCCREEMVLSSVRLCASDSLSDKLVAVLRGQQMQFYVVTQICFFYSEVTLVVFLSDNHRQHMQVVLSYMACLLCLAHHSRYEQKFSKSKLFPNTMCGLE